MKGCSPRQSQRFSNPNYFFHGIVIERFGFNERENDID